MPALSTSQLNMKATGRTLQKITLTVSLFFLGMTYNALAQHNQGRTITINMSASEMLPADLIIFNININAEAENPQKAFETHKKRESALAELLQEYDISEENIDYEPIQIQKRHRNDDDSKTTVTSQSVSITFSDFSVYEDIQISLIENNFDSFHGQFSSSELSKGKEKALIKAIEAAKEKAELIANTSGVELGEVKRINYSDHEIGFPRKAMAYQMETMTSDASMMDFAQTVSVTSNINISFGIE